MLMRWIATGLIGVLAIAAAHGTDVTPDHPAGWRQNWTGRFPDCHPPVSWERRCTAPVSEIRYSALPPANSTAAGAFTPLTQSINHWMVLGPFVPKNHAQALEEETVTGEAALAPDAAATKTQWLPYDTQSVEEIFNEDRPTDDITEAIQFEQALNEKAVAALPPNQGVAYAHTYLYSPRAGSVGLLLNHANGLKIWVNGQVAYSHGAPVISGCVDHYQFAKFGWHWGRTVTVDLKLKQGWNHLLCKCVRGDKGWMLNTRLTAPSDATYTSKNIAWEAHLPSRGFSCPVVVGDRIFMTLEVDDLICLDKKDGRILWRRSNNFYDAASPEERAANPLWASLEPINAKLQTTASYPESLALHRQMQEVLLKIDKAKFNWGDPRFGPVQGNAVPTACSDGKQVYVYFSSGVAACYDLDGNRKWIRNNRDMGNVGGYNTQSPAIVDGTFIIYRHQVRGLDAVTGAVKWTAPLTGEDERAQCVVPVTIGAEKCVLAHHNHFYRASDGLFMGGGDPVHHATAVFMDDNTLINCADSNFGQGRILGIDAKSHSVKVQPLPGCGSPFSGTYNVASPLFADGMAYVMNINGSFMAWEYSDSKAKLDYAFKHVPNMHPFVQAWNWNVGVCGSPILAGNYVYLMDNQGTTISIEKGSKYKPIAVNKIENYLPRGWVTNTQENSNSSPVCDGDSLYFRGDETLYCIRGASALLQADTTGGEAALPVNFDGTRSFSGNGKITRYAWDFGDKTTSDAATVTHTYAAAGTYVATLTVTDASGVSAEARTEITVLPPDTVAPQVVSAVAGFGDKIVLTFSKPMARASVEDKANYILSPTLEVRSVHVLENARAVVLTTAPQSAETRYTVAWKTLTDCARKPNVLPPGTISATPTALVAHWKLDAASGTAIADSSGFCNDAKIKDTQTPQWEPGGAAHPGNALRFNGTENNIVVAANEFPELGVAFSVSFWVNPSQQQEKSAGILGKSGGGFSGFALQNEMRDSTHFSFVYGDGKQWHGCGPLQLVPNVWQHVAIVCDGAQVALYLNGVEIPHGEAPAPPAPNGRSSFRLGQGFSNGRYFRGMLSDVRVYTKALSSTEVKELAEPPRGEAQKERAGRPEAGNGIR